MCKHLMYTVMYMVPALATTSHQYIAVACEGPNAKRDKHQIHTF